MQTKLFAVGRVALLLCVVQALRFVFEGMAWWVLPHTWLTDGLVRIAAYAVLLVALMWRARRERRALAAEAANSIACNARGGSPSAQVQASLPKCATAEGAGLCAGDARTPCATGPSPKKTRIMRIAYLVGLGAFAALFVATPFATGQALDLASWVCLACIAIATPVFEEWLFRGYVWRRLRLVFGSGWQLVAVTSVLFGLWHLGYADVVAWEIVQPEALGSAPLWAHLGVKAGFATLMGALLGVVRLRSGGWMAPALVHGLWNLLA